MIRTFIKTDEFVKQWEKLGLTDEDLRKLELEILKNPQAGPVIRGTGGLRKLRFAYENKGKSGSTRICYVDYVIYETVYLITAYAKNEKDNLTESERNEIRKVIMAIGKQLQEGEC